MAHKATKETIAPMAPSALIAVIPFNDPIASIAPIATVAPMAHIATKETIAPMAPLALIAP